MRTRDPHAKIELLKDMMPLYLVGLGPCIATVDPIRRFAAQSSSSPTVAGPSRDPSKPGVCRTRKGGVIQFIGGGANDTWEIKCRYRTHLARIQI